MGGRGSAGRALNRGPIPPEPEPEPDRLPNPHPAGDHAPRALDLDDLRTELRNLKYAREDRPLTPAETGRLAALGRENDRRAAIRGAETRAEGWSKLASQHDEWRTEHGPDTPAEARVRDALTALSLNRDPEGNHGEWIPLHDARAAVPDLSRTEFDAALKRLGDDPQVTLIPATDPTALSEDQHAAGLKVGGKNATLFRARDARADAARAAQRAHELTADDT